MILVKMTRDELKKLFPHPKRSKLPANRKTNKQRRLAERNGK